MKPTDNPTQRRRSVLLLDDHRVFTDLLQLTLDMQHDLHCVAVAHTVADGLAAATATAVDVAVVDLQLPEISGIDAIAALRAIRPNARIIVLTAHPTAALAERAIEQGAVAFLAKNGSLADILNAVRHADASVPVICPEALDDPAAHISLTPREHDVLCELGRGHDAARIAGALGISRHTTRDHIKSILLKLGAHSQLDAVVSAGRLGLIDLGSRY